MKAKDLINLLFKAEESKEVQQGLFYTQYGTISNFISKNTQNVMEAKQEAINHELARLFVSQFTKDIISLDDFLYQYSDQLSDEQKDLGYYISKQF